MKAIGLTAFGGPEVLRVLDLPVPEAGPGEIRIRVHAATVNPVDTLVRRGIAFVSDAAPPYVPGMDAAGVVEQIGAGVDTDLAVGDHVMAVVVVSGTHGAYAEHVVVPAESVVRVPAGTTEIETATLPMNGLTARMALDLLELPTGATVAVTGAAGAVGGYAVQLAKADGLREAGGGAGLEQVGFVLVLGYGPVGVGRLGGHGAVAPGRRGPWERSRARTAAVCRTVPASMGVQGQVGVVPGGEADMGFGPCSTARCSLVVRPPRERPSPWSSGSTVTPPGGSFCSSPLSSPRRRAGGPGTPWSRR